MRRTVGLYVHIPFCRSKCAYCDFYSMSVQEKTIWDDYVKALVKHIKETGSSLGSHAVDTVYFGGGTPSLIGHKRLVTLLESIDKHCRLSQGAEISLEGNPDSLEEKSLKKLRRGGFNRLSIGVQSFDDGLLKMLSRPHSSDQAQQAFHSARKAGFDNISLDLLFGLPWQTAAQWAHALHTAVSLGPEHVSCYGLKLEEGTPLHLNRGEYAFPDDDTQADQYFQCVEGLERAGYKQYEISNFARPGYECRHNMKYWTLQPYVGLGPAAHSDFGNRRWSYVRDLKSYVNGVNEEGVLTDDMEEIPRLERAGEYVMLGLRTARGISGNEYSREFRVSFDALEERLEVQKKRGLAAREGDRWRLTPQGFLLSNRIIGDLLEALSETERRVSTQ